MDKKRKTDTHSAIDLFGDDEIDELFDFAFPPPNTQAEPHPGAMGNHLVVRFIEASLHNIGWTRADLAEQLSTDVELVNRILEGKLAPTDLDEELLTDIAHAIGYEPAVLQIFMEYDRVPQTNLRAFVDKLVNLAIDGSQYGDSKSEIRSQAEELDDLQKDLANLLLQGFGGYYNAEIQDNPKQQMLYQSVIKAVESAIANYKTDIEEARATIERIKQNYQSEIKSIQEMIAQLKAATEVEAFMKNSQAKSASIRIIEHIENDSNNT